MAAASALAGLAVVSGCGSSGDPVAKAAQKTMAMHTARLVERTSAPRSSTLSYQSVGGNGSGTVDFDSGRSRVELGRSGYYEILDGTRSYFENTDHTWTRSDDRKVLSRRFGPQTGRSDVVLGALLQNRRRPVKLGKATLDGQRMTRYRKKVGPGGYPLDVWIGKDGLVRQVRLSTRTNGVGEFTTTIRYEDFGTPVHITLPPAGKVTTFTNGGR